MSVEKLTACRRSLLFTETSNSTGGRHDLPPKQTKEVIVKKKNQTGAGEGRGGNVLIQAKHRSFNRSGVGYVMTLAFWDL